MRKVFSSMVSTAGWWPLPLGRCGRAQIPHLAALALADRLGIMPVSFRGDQRFAAHPGPFADTVRKALRES